MDGIQFNWSMNIGHLLNLLVFILGGISFFVSLAFNIRAIGGRITKIELNIKSHLSDFKSVLDKQTDILVVVARQDEQLKSHTEQLRDLRHHSNPR